ncbi:unnamed protein product [Cunninghamella blakesleeana]
MDSLKPADLPGSVLKRIFQHIHSQRYLSPLLLVNSKWFYFAQHEMYKTIHFYSFDQLLHFLDIIENHTNETTSPLFIIKHIVFHFDLLTACDIRLPIYKAINSNDHDIQSLEKQFYYYSEDIAVSKYNNCNSICNALLKNCKNVESITILDKEKHMKQLRYKDDKHKSQYAYFLYGDNLKYVPYWHLDSKTFYYWKTMQIERLDLYVTSSNLCLLYDMRLRIIFFPNLTHLYIDFFNETKTFTIDQHVFNYLHYNCNQLNSLTIINVDIAMALQSSDSADLQYNGMFPNRDELDDHHITINKNDYIYITEPSTIFLKHLCLKNVKIAHSPTTTLKNTIDYFIQKYPLLNSLDIQLDYHHFIGGGLNPSDIKERRKIFRSHMFKLFSSFKSLTSFHFTLHPSMNHEIAKSIWPQYEVFNWLALHPNQINSLSWPCDLYGTTPFSINHQHHPNYIPLNKKFLYYLKDLNLAIGKQCNQSFLIQDFLYNHNNNNNKNASTILPCLESLTLHYMERSSSLKETSHHPTDDQQQHLPDSFYNNSKQIEVFTWLDICPILKNLTLKGVDLVNPTTMTTTMMNNQDDINEKEKDHLHQQEQDLKKLNDQINKLSINENHEQRTYPLQKLTLEQVDIYMNNGLDDICKRCPILKTIWCDYINCRWQPTPIINYMIDYETFCKSPIFTLHADHLVLDTLYLGYINNVFQEHNYTFTIGKALIYELNKSSSSSSTSILEPIVVMDTNIDGKQKEDISGEQIKEKNEEENQVPYIEVYCQLMDQVTLKGKHFREEKDAFTSYLLIHPKNQEHIQLAKLSKKGLKAYEEEKKCFEEWDYIDNNDEDILITSDDDLESINYKQDENVKERDNDNINNDNSDYEYDDDCLDLEENDNDDEFLLN